jgi:hypothetical protein
MTQITQAQALKTSSADLLAMARRSTVVVTKRGRPMCALFPLDGRDWESYVVARSPVFKKIIRQSRQSYVKHGGIKLEAIKKEYGLK